MTRSENANDPLRLIRCKVGAESYFLELSRVVSILRADRVQPLPGSEDDVSDPWVGTIPQTSGDVPVQDLGRRLGLTPDADFDGIRQVVLLATQPWQWALRVDRLSQVPPIPRSAMQPLPASVRTPETAWARQVVLFENEPMILLDPENLGPEAEPSPVSAATVEEAPDGLTWEHGNTERLVLFGLAKAALGERPLRFGLRISQVVEVLEEPTIRVVPGAGEHVLGLTAWRNRVLPVIDLSRRLGCEGTTSRARVLVVWTGEALAGLRVEADIQVVPLPLPHQPSSRDVGEVARAVRGVVETKHATLAILDLAQVL